MSPTSVALQVADTARASVLRGLCSIHWLRPYLASTRHRLVLFELIAVAWSAVVSLWAPLIALWMGAALFGIPHVIAGVRTVAINRSLSRVTLIACAAAACIGVAQIAGADESSLRAFIVVFFIAVVFQVRKVKREWPVKLLATACLACLTCAAYKQPARAVVVLAHVHGLGALAFFFIAARRKALPRWPLVLGASALMTLAASGALDGAMARTLYAPRGAAGSILAEAIGAAAPGASSQWFRRALFLYAFGQSLHFAVWLRLMPEVDRKTPTPKPFRTSYRSFQNDFKIATKPLLFLAVAGMFLMFAYGGLARETYFALTYFHVGLEAAALAGLCLSA